MNTPRFALLACAAAASLVGCREPSRPNLVLIVVDTLRADHLEVYGGRGVHTPAIDRLASTSIIHERALSPIPLTLPAHVSMLSGLLPAEHGVRDNSGFPVAVPPDRWLPSRLSAAGYQTGAAVSAVVLRGETGFGKGFGWFDQPQSTPGLPLGGQSRDGRSTARNALRWIDSVDRTKPFFLLLHLYEPHLPYEPAAAYAVEYRDRPYDGEIATVDSYLGEFLADLDRRGIADSSWIALVSDHGEGLGEHGEEEHGVLLYREALHVPLLIKPPHSRSTRRIQAPVSLLDIAPTLETVARLGAPDRLHSWPLGEAPAGRIVLSESYYGQLHYGWGRLLSAVRESHHVIHGPRPELFEFVSDPAERIDLSGRQPELVLELSRHAQRFDRPPGDPDPLERSQREALLALGYLTGGTRPALGEAPPAPQDRIASAGRLATALQVSSRDPPAAQRLLEALILDEPRMADAWDRLGWCRAQRADWGGAAAAYARAHALNDDPESGLSEIAALLEVERFGEARAALHTLAEQAPARLSASRLLYMARRLLRLEQPELALVWLETAARNSEPGPEALELRQRALLALESPVGTAERPAKPSRGPAVWSRRP